MTTSDTDLDVGPIDYLIVEFPADVVPDGAALRELYALVVAGTIRVLDLAFVRSEADGTVVGIDIAATGLGDADITLFAEASTGLLDDSDLADSAPALTPGCTAAIIVYENTWAGPFATALRHKGAQLVASGRIPVPALLASLDALDGLEERN